MKYVSVFTGDCTFYGVLSKYMYKLLEERQCVFMGEKPWLLNLDSKKLQSEGAFIDDLAMKCEAAIIPILSGIIACIDRNYNLDLIHQEENPITQFWLTIFGNSDIMGFYYKEVVSMKQVTHHGIGGGKAEEDFQCQLPFSWLIKEAIDNQWDGAKSVASMF